MFRIGTEDLYGIAKEILEKGKTLEFIAGGESMSPFIKDGDTVVVQHPGSLNIGNIALCRTPECRLILHRIVKVTGTGIITRGDACFTDDGFTSFEHTIGKVVKVSGRGLNFHLRFPFSTLIARGAIRPSRFSRHPLLLSFGRRLASFLG
jgi:hypothetical protein